MSGRRRVKNITYDEDDDYWDGYSNDDEEENDDNDEGREHKNKSGRRALLASKQKRGTNVSKTTRGEGLGRPPTCSEKTTVTREKQKQRQNVVAYPPRDGSATISLSKTSTPLSTGVKTSSSSAVKVVGDSSHASTTSPILAATAPSSQRVSPNAAALTVSRGNRILGGGSGDAGEAQMPLKMKATTEVNIKREDLGHGDKSDSECRGVVITTSDREVQKEQDCTKKKAEKDYNRHSHQLENKQSARNNESLPQKTHSASLRNENTSNVASSVLPFSPCREASSKRQNTSAVVQSSGNSTSISSSKFTTTTTTTTTSITTTATTTTASKTGRPSKVAEFDDVDRNEDNNNNNLAIETENASSTSTVTGPGDPSVANKASIVLEDDKISPYSLVVIGHVDAGKSTLTGQLLFLTGAVNEKEVEKMKRMSSLAGKGSFFYAWLCDEGEDERQRGVTIDVSCRIIVTAKKHRRISFLDAPGHHELVSSMLGGAVLADAALLVVDAVKFDAGFEGQTKEHLLIARSLNIQHFIVAVNKMDAIEWSETAYNDVVSRLRNFLTGPEIACPAKQIHFVPVSALLGVNVACGEVTEICKCSGRRRDTSTGGQQNQESLWNDTKQLELQTKLLRSWWNGPSLVDLLEDIQINTLGTQRRLTNEPFAACVADMWSLSSSFEDLSFSFKVASGALNVGDKVGALPANVVLVCKALSSYGVATKRCASGDYVERGVFSYAPSAPAIDKHLPSAGIEAVGVGTVLCSSTRLLRVVSSFLCKIVVFSRELPLMPGRQMVAYIHTMSTQCVVRRVVATINKKTGEVVKQKQARCCALVFGMAGVVEVDVSPGKVCVREKKEPHEQTSVLSRIILRDPTGTAAAGVVVEDAGL